MGLTSTILPGSKSARAEYLRCCHNQFACFQSALNLNVCQLKFGQLEINFSVHFTLVSPFISMSHEFSKKVFLRWDKFQKGKILKHAKGLSTLLGPLCKKFWWNLVWVILAKVQTKWTCLSQGGGLVKYAAAAKPPFFFSYVTHFYHLWLLFCTLFYLPMAAAMKCLKTLNQQL